MKKMDSEHKYRELNTDNPDSSLAESQELLDENENGADWDVKSPRRRSWARIKQNWWIVNTFLLLIILLLLVEQRWHREKNEYEFGGDLTGFAPRFSQKITTFEPDMGFFPENVSDIWTEDVQNKWLSIVPRALGYVRVDNPSDYNNLPNPIHDYPNMTVFTTSVTHQLHCLYNIFVVYAAVTSENPHNTPTGMTFHLQHCFEYLRLNIMCSGDVALEGAETTFPEGFDGSDGWDSKHICKDYSQIYDYMDKYRANDKLWI